MAACWVVAVALCCWLVGSRHEQPQGQGQAGAWACTNCWHGWLCHGVNSLLLPLLLLLPLPLQAGRRVPPPWLSSTPSGRRSPWCCSSGLPCRWVGGWVGGWVGAIAAAWLLSEQSKLGPHNPTSQITPIRRPCLCARPAGRQQRPRQRGGGARAGPAPRLQRHQPQQLLLPVPRLLPLPGQLPRRWVCSDADLSAGWWSVRLQFDQACMPAALHACQPASLPACQPASLPPCLPACMHRA